MKAADKFVKTTRLFNKWYTEQTQISEAAYLSAIEQFSNSLIELSNSTKRVSIIVEVFYPDRNKSSVDLMKDCGVLFLHMYSLFSDCIKSPSSLERYSNAVDKVLFAESVNIDIKNQLICYETKFVYEVFNRFLSGNVLGVGSAKKRCDLLTYNLERIEQKFKIKIYTDTAHLVTSSHIINGQILQLASYLNDLLQIVNDEEAKKVLIKEIVHISSSFEPLDKGDLEILLDSHRQIFSDDELAWLNVQIHQNLDSVSMGGVSSHFNDIDLLKLKNEKIYTYIRFSIPYQYKHSDTAIITSEKFEVYVNGINSFWQDPIFIMFMNSNFGGVGWRYFSDLNVDSAEGYTHVIIKLKELFAPHKEVINGKSMDKSFSEKEAIEGRTYYPHKEKAIKSILDTFEDFNQLVSIKRKDVNYKLFSNFIVHYHDENQDHDVAMSLYAMTNPDSFEISRSRLLELLSEKNMNSPYSDIRNLLDESSMETELSLRNFVQQSLEICFVKGIEMNGGYRYLWEKNSNDNSIPLSETEIQPLISLILKPIFEYMGISITREVKSANGSIDFLITFTNSRRRLVKVCVELKLAHSQKVTDGLLKQLPRYMRAEGCRYGIYLVLWFKDKQLNFHEPKKYSSRHELLDKLETIHPDKSISKCVIDCGKPISPSKL